MSVEEAVVEKLRMLPPERRREVLEFAEFLESKSHLPIDEFERLQTFIEDAQDLFLLRQAKAEDDGERISLAEVEARLGLTEQP